MNIELAWRADPLVSALHAAHAVDSKLALADSRLAAIENPARQLGAEIRAAKLPAARFWSHLIPLAASSAGRRLLVETAVTKTAGRNPRFETVVRNISASIAGVETAMQSAMPEIADELAHRERPLREQWEARGPGMLRKIANVTDDSLIVPGCDVLLVHPATGGGGEAHLAYNSVRIEAVLANPVAEIPEAVRLAWLIAQLQIDLPLYSESIHADRLPHIARYAMLPAALLAAETVDLARFTPENVQRGIYAWRLAAPPGVDSAALITEWWQTYLETRPPWRVALAALDQMFG